MGAALRMISCRVRSPFRIFPPRHISSATEWSLAASYHMFGCDRPVSGRIETSLRSAWKAKRYRNRKILRIGKEEKDMKKTSKTILITGASSGFGRDMAETLSADAHKVYGGVRDLAGRNSAATEALRGKGVEV